MKAFRTSVSWLWRLAAAGASHAAGLVIGGAGVAALGLQPPRALPTAEPAAAALLVWLGGICIALGLAAMAVGLAGSLRRRWLILGGFAFVVNGVGTALELGGFSTLGGGVFTTLANLPASFLCAFVVARLFPPLAAGGTMTSFAGIRKRPARLLLALLAFPCFYFLFGLMIAPIVLPHYEHIDFIVVPPMPVLLSLIMVRGALFLLVSLPVVTHWSLSRGRLALGLATGHFTAVGLSGLVQATFFPAVVRWTHGVEILATSICYGFVLAWLLFRAPESASPAPRAGARQHTGRRRIDSAP